MRDLNHFLVKEFKHEWDHLGGFWKLVRRGGTKRYREIDLGTVEPFGGGNGADTCIAELDLEEGELLKWVFDFGDWFEYRLLLEHVTPAAEAASGDVYPRVTGRNAPVLRYCEQCQQKGKQVVATGICMDCSNLHQRDVMLCDKCAGSRKHTDHYVVDLVY